jgi:cytidylate kinase
MSYINKITVAVDGPAGTGKSSVCRKIASDLGISYIDSGAIYRSITWFFLDKWGGNIDSSNNYSDNLSEINIEQIYDPEKGVISHVNGRDVSLLIREEEITGKIGFFSDNIKVRNFVNDLLRSWSREHSIIMDGRDIGSVVFPDADIKVYLDATVEIRTERRVKEYQQMGKNVDEIIIKNQIIQRDLSDMNREFGGLKMCDDALYIDTSHMPFNDVVLKLENIIKDYQMNMINNKV